MSEYTGEGAEDYIHADPEQLEGAWDQVQEWSGEAWDAVTEAASTAQEAVQEGVEEAGEWLGEKWDQLTDFVEENPDSTLM